METSGTDGAMETVATREWVIREVDGDGVLVDQLPDGPPARLDPALLPDDVTEGDRFRVVAQVDRRGRRDGRDTLTAEDPARDGGASAREDGPDAEEAGGSAGSDDLPDAMHEALRRLT